LTGGGEVFILASPLLQLYAALKSSFVAVSPG